MLMEGVSPYLTRDLGPGDFDVPCKAQLSKPMPLLTPKIVGARWPNRSLRAIVGLKSVDTRSVTNRMGRNINGLSDDSAVVQKRGRGCVHARSGTSFGLHQRQLLSF